MLGWLRNVCLARVQVLAAHLPRTAGESASGKLSGPEALPSLRDTALIPAKQYNWRRMTWTGTGLRALPPQPITTGK
jgi:hypothetical protein